MLIVVHLSFIGLAIAAFWLSQKAARGESSVGSAGLRTSATTHSSETWKAGHSAALPLLKLNIVVQVIANIAAIILERQEDLVLVALNIPVVLMMIVLALAMSKANAAANKLIQH